MRYLTLLFVTALLSACCTLAPLHENLPFDCGPYPEGYEEMLREYVMHILGGPENLKDFVIFKKPERIDLDTNYPQIPLMKMHSVWETYILYNGKYEDGKYIGKRLHVAWIRFDRLVAFDYEAVDMEYFLGTRF